jgi:hypothetical protein
MNPVGPANRPHPTWLLPLLCAASLAANAVLASRWGRAPASTEVASHGATSRRPAAVADGRIDPETWTELAGIGDPADYVARLRALGYPPSIVRALVRARLTEQYADRLKAISDAIADQPYWRGAAYNIDPKITAAQRAIYREINAAMRQLVGPDFLNASDADRLSLRRRFGDLAPEKIDALQQITSDYNEMISEIRLAARGTGFTSVMLPDDREKLAYLEREMRSDLAKQLTPEEMDAYDLRNGRTGSALRASLAMFEPTEQEFLAIYRLQKSVDDRLPPTELLTPEQRRERSEAIKALTTQIAATLGPERFAEYEKKTDTAWQNNQRFANEFSLAPEAVEKLYAIQKEMGDRARDIRTASPPRDQLVAQLTTLQAEATLRVNAVLGEKLSGAYRSTRGYWLQSLEPPRAAPKQ